MLDKLDLNILKILQINCKITTEQLGYQVGLSATACQRRIKKLRESGVISNEIAVLNGDIIGNFVTIIVNVTFKQGGKKNISSFKSMVLKTPEVQQCYYVTGDSDFVLIISVSNMKEYEKLTQRPLLNDPNIEKFSSTVVMENVKTSLSIPL